MDNNANSQQSESTDERSFISMQNVVYDMQKQDKEELESLTSPIHRERNYTNYLETRTYMQFEPSIQNEHNSIELPSQSLKPAQIVSQQPSEYTDKILSQPFMFKEGSCNIANNYFDILKSYLIL